MAKTRLLFLGVGALGAAALLLAPTDRPDSSTSGAPSGDAHATARPAADSVQAQVAAETAAAAQTWRVGEVLVQLEDGVDAARLAKRVGAALIDAPSGTGLAVFAVDSGDALGVLRSAPGVRSVGPHAVVTGAKGDKGPLRSAKTGSEGEERAVLHDTEGLLPQWHIAEVGGVPVADLSNVTVAVLDSGVSASISQSLANNSIIAPADFVDKDDVPDDEHWHGTHIASLIASNGSVLGTAPGVELMPVRVLDRSNAGTELALITGINHAVINGADVINMSLAFGPDYVPSAALLEAIELAHASGVVMVAAAGNDGQMAVSWPAASPRVIGVGASTLDQLPASYGNHGPLLDLTAPGGDMGVDTDLDGYPDGLLAETVVPGDPKEVGYFYAAGSSQAAALVSGAAAQMLADGVAPHQVVAVLQGASSEWSANSNHQHGVGLLDIQQAVDKDDALSFISYNDRDYHVALMPWLSADKADLVQPRMRVTLFDGDGQLAKSEQTIRGVLHDGEQTTAVSCTLPAGAAQCDLVGQWLSARDVGADGTGMWTFQVQSIEETQAAIAWRPRGAITVTDGVEMMASALGGVGLSSSPIGISWSAMSHPELGDIADSLALTSSGAGYASPPAGVLFVSEILDDMTQEVLDLDLDGTGLASIPIGTLSLLDVSLSLDLNGTGLASSPIGTLSLYDMNMLMISGSSSPSEAVGIDALTLFANGGDNTDGSLIGAASAPLFLDEAHSPTVDLSGSTLQAVADTGGWLNSDGMEPAAVMMAMSLPSSTTASAYAPVEHP